LSRAEKSRRNFIWGTQTMRGKKSSMVIKDGERGEYGAHSTKEEALCRTTLKMLPVSPDHGEENRKLRGKKRSGEEAFSIGETTIIKKNIPLILSKRRISYGQGRGGGLKTKRKEV